MFARRSFALLFVAGLLLPVAVSVAQESSNTAANTPSGPSYVVDLTKANTNYVTVTMTADPTGAVTELMMPTWTPGSYLLREYAKHIDRISVQSDKEELPILKTKKNRWVIQTPSLKPFTVTYRIFCKEASVRTNYVDNTHAVLNGAATFITIPEQMGYSHQIDLLLPEAWTGAASSMRTDPDEEYRFLADDYDEVVDSPIVAGLVDVFPFEVAGVPHYLVNVNDEGNWDGERAARDLARLVAAHHTFWGSVPYDRYYFLNVINNSGGGLEHDNGCLMMTGQRSARTEGGYLRWLSLCSHEFFHTWNVRRMRPKSLVKYDYEAEVYTPSLWVAEGVTSYYEDLLLVRAGLMEPAAFVRNLSGMVRGVQNREGRKVQSLRDSSHDAWIKYYRPEENSRDTQVSYYNKGGVAAFLLDMEIRIASAGKHSLDDALRIMYDRFANGIGYTPKDVRAVCSEVAGVDLNPWFDSVIDSTDELDFRNVANWLDMQVGDVFPDYVDEADLPKPRQRAWIGLGEEDSPATAAGLQEDDEILAINGKRLTEELKDEVERADIGDEWKLLISRKDKIQELELTVGAQDIPPRWRMALREGAKVRQRVNRYDWFDAPEKPVESEVVVQPAQYKWTKFVPEPELAPIQ